jgi:hypothetical protein
MFHNTAGQFGSSLVGLPQPSQHRVKVVTTTSQPHKALPHQPAQPVAPPTHQPQPNPHPSIPKPTPHQPLGKTHTSIGKVKPHRRQSFFPQHCIALPEAKSGIRLSYQEELPSIHPC